MLASTPTVPKTFVLCPTCPLLPCSCAVIKATKGNENITAVALEKMTRKAENERLMKKQAKNEDEEGKEEAEDKPITGLRKNIAYAQGTTLQNHGRCQA